MSSYPRTDEGFARALEDTARMARWHPDKQYALLVDRRSPDRYSCGLASLVHEEHVEPGTRANIIDAEKNMTPMFQKDEPMTQFTADNTDGFTENELQIMNEAFAEIKAGTRADDTNICDHINNAFYPGVTKEELIEQWPNGA